MKSKYNSHMVGWAEGKGTNLASSKNKTQSWGQLKKLLSEPFVTPEKRREFDAMSKDEQDKLKAVNGWISGAQCKDNHRSLKNILPRDLLTLDIDYAPDTILEDIREGFIGCAAYEGFWHSSRRHTEEAPRVRFFAPMSRKVELDEYLAIVRYVAWLIDREMKTVDPVSFRGAQMMFKPSCSKDDADIYFAFEQVGDLLDPDKVLARFTETFGDWHDMAVWPKHPNEELRKKADKAEDPRTKKGPVGTFCRAYSIEAAMETFIPGYYIPGDSSSTNPRYTYKGATSSNGAVVYDDGLFIYSNHGSDPIADMNCNAFDMVRIHLFGDEDEKIKGDDVEIGKRPSFKAMLDFIAEDKGYKAQLAQERYDYSAMFDEAGITPEDYEDDEENEEEEGDQTEPDPEEDEDVDPDLQADLDDIIGSGPEGPAKGQKKARAYVRPRPSKPRKPRKDWFPGDLELDRQGNILPTLHNISVIAVNDPRFMNAFWWNRFTRSIVVRKTLVQTKATPELVCPDPDFGIDAEDDHIEYVRALLEGPNGQGLTGYGLNAVQDRNMRQAVRNAALMTQFHPIADYLLNLKWDGKRRVETMFQRYLGTPDHEYYRQVAKLMLVASVTRIFHPGHKFDFAAIIEGEQGIRKSTFVRVLYGDRFFGEIHTDLDDKQKVVEALKGLWGVELPELSSLNKTDHNAAKAFMRTQVDFVRLPYKHQPEGFPRQCICWGTTNDEKYLRDPTGNRSYFPVRALIAQIDTDMLAEERDQLWAEATAMFFEMREEQPEGELPLFLRGAAAIEARRLQEGARTGELHEEWTEAITDWLDEPVSLYEFKQQLELPQNEMFDEDEKEIMIKRMVFRTSDILEHALKRHHTVVADAASNITLKKALSKLEGWSHENPRFRVQGKLGRWFSRKGATQEDLVRGYRLVRLDTDDNSDVI